MKRARMVNLCGAVAAAVLFIALLAGSPVEAKDAKETEARYNVNFSMADNLSGFKGKAVYVHLKSGQTLTGKVKAVGNHLVHLEKLAGKDFYDALIRLDDISAIDARFR